MLTPQARNPRREAEERVGGQYQVRVLEPSPPAVDGGPWFADDPVNADAANGRPVISPVGNGDLTWDQQSREEPGISQWCADHWLGAWRPLASVPAGLVEPRDALHQLAFHAIAPARHAHNTKIGLRYTMGGFGTPFFGDDVQVRVEGSYLVIQRSDRIEVEPITTLGAARRLLDIDSFLPFKGPEPWHLDRPLGVGEPHVRFLSDWFGFATVVLEELRYRPVAIDRPSRVQIWPEHFDAAVEIGAEEGAHRAAFGASPGDAAHPEPYLYVSPWVPPGAHPHWNDAHFKGASLSYQELLAAPHQRSAALDFYQTGIDILGRPASS